MKRSFLTLISVLALAGLISAQPSTTPSDPNKPASQAEIIFDTDVHDFGTIQKGEPAEFEFKLRNTGKEPLIISNCQKSCGCTTPKCPTEPILPGQSSSIKVSYNTNSAGVFHKTVTVVSNAKNESNKTLTIKGKVDAPPAEDIFPGSTSNQAPKGAPVNK
jgi:hypothetical protein